MELMLLLLLLLLLSRLIVAESSCGTIDQDLLARAFNSVSGYQPPPLSADDDTSCKNGEIHEIRLPSKNLTGTVSWVFLRNISALHVLDLSGNSLQGSVPGSFWSAPALVEVNLSSNRLGGALRFEPSSHVSQQPSLRVLNISSNRFTNSVGLLSFPALEVIDLSRNRLSSLPNLEDLRSLRYLDLSNNSMSGSFPGDLPSLQRLSFLNVSYNNFTGHLDSKLVEKFGRSAFIKAGSLTFTSSARAHGPSPTHKERHKSRSKTRILRAALIAAASATIGLGSFGVLLFVRAMRRRREGRAGGRKKRAETWATTPLEAAWVAEARPATPVVVFEKPLIKLTFADLVAATSGFGRESQLAEGGRSGPVYRAVLPGEMHVVVRVLETARGLDEPEAVATFRELARLRHPNLLPLLGYCIAGKEKLVLYEYLERGDLHRWLHELPAGQTDVEDWSSDTWEHHQGTSAQRKTAMAAVGHWPTRHRIALGVARGLAFLHQGWVGSRRPVVHGHLVSFNILLGEDLEPRLADFAAWDEGVSTAEGDVYDYGVVVMELVTGRANWTQEAVVWARAMVRDGRAAEVVDPRLWWKGSEDAVWEREAVVTLRVGYLCTAQSPEKRPTMQQVVGLLKDIRPTVCTPSCSSSSTNLTTDGEPKRA